MVQKKTAKPYTSLNKHQEKIMRPSADHIFMMLRREWMPATSTYDTMKSTPSIMDDPSAHVLEYRSYLFVNVSCFYPKRYSMSEYLCVWW